MAKGGVLRRW